MVDRNVVPKIDHIHTHYAHAIAFIVYSIQVFSSHDDEIRIKKEKEEYTIERPQQNVSFFSLNKSLCEKKLHISQFRVQKFADKGGFPLSLKFYIVCALVFDWHYVRKQELMTRSMQLPY